MAEHNPTPTLSSANAKGRGASPCSKTFNPSYVEIAGENKVGGVIVRTDGCAATNGALSFAPCNVTTGVCGDLEPMYQATPSQGTQDPRVIYDPYSNYFYNFASVSWCGGMCVGGGGLNTTDVIPDACRSLRVWQYTAEATVPFFFDDGAPP